MDEVIKSEFFYQNHTDELTHRCTQPTEELILKHNKEARKDNVYGDLTFGRQVASIPFITYAKALREGYDLNSKEPGIASKEMMRFLKSPEGQMCLVRDKI